MAARGQSFRALDALRAFGEMTEASGELIRLEASIVGEMAVDSVALAPWVDLAAMIDGEERPLQVVVAIPEGVSTRKWYYEMGALNDIHQGILSNGLPGFLGHQKPEDVDTQFPVPATHWIGSRIDTSNARAILYVRGLIDRSMDNLKRWIRTRMIRQVSIYGRPKLSRSAAGETRVVGYAPLSIDWTPLNRAGMPTRIVAMGEMDRVLAAGEQPPPEETSDVNLSEIVAWLKTNKTTAPQLAGEMGWTFDSIAGEMGGDAHRAIVARADALGEVAAALGLEKTAPSADVLSAATAARTAQSAAGSTVHQQLVDKVIGEMVAAEHVRPLVKDLLRIEPGTPEPKIKEAVGEIMAREHVKAMLGATFRTTAVRGGSSPAASTNSGSSGGQSAPSFPAGLRARTISI